MTRILVIEDEKKLRDNIVELLFNENYEVDSAENGALGIKKVNEKKPDLIICDIMMPEMNGYEVLKELQKDIINATIPFIFLTAKVEMSDLRNGMNLGADDYLFKPFDMEELLSTVETRLRKKEANLKPLVESQDQITLKMHHDLRTPLIPIIGYAEMIEEIDDLEKVKELVRIMKKSGKMLHEKVEKFMIYRELTAMESGIKPFHAGRNVSEISNTMVEGLFYDIVSPLEADKRTVLKLETAEIQMEEWFLRIAVKELLENGLKYSEIDKKVTVIGEKIDSNYKLTFMDEGKGMAENEINSIRAFNKFGDNVIAEVGLGLGLVLTQKIVTLHKGIFNICSELDSFTNVILTLPLNNNTNGLS